MENASLLSGDVWDNVSTTYSSTADDGLTLYLANIRDLALKIIYIIIGTVGVLDNMFVLAIFILFIKITKKVNDVWAYLCPFSYFFELPIHGMQ